MDYRNRLLDLLTEQPEPAPRNRITDMLSQPSTADVHRTLDSTVVNRGNFVPLVEYASGRVGAGWPNFLPGHKVADMLTPGYDYDSPQAARDAFDVAGAIGVGSIAAPRPSNSLGIFGGRLAKTADNDALARAEQMAAQGVPREQIWNETGWFQGVDGKWRFEIDDSGATLGSGATVGDALSHQRLLAAYPFVGQYEFDVRPIGRKQFGAFSPGDDPSGLPPSIAVSQGGQRGLSSALHEIQHGIQGSEGFATGANQFGMSDAAVQIYRQIRKRMATPLTLEEWATSQFDGNIDAARASYKDYLRTAGKITPELDRMAQETAVEQAYRRAAGEVEARAVQARQDLTPEQRRARAPWLDYDVPENQQIVRFK